MRTLWAGHPNRDATRQAMLVTKRERSGAWTMRWCCCVCETTATTVAGWRALVSAGDDEPAVVCANAECAAEVRRDWPTKTWVALPLKALLTDLALRYGSPRRSWRCGICRDINRRTEIDKALVDGMTQRQVAERFGFAKSTVASHAIAHLPVTAMIAAGRR